MNITLTFDIDWAHDTVIADTITLLEKYKNVKATFFITHKTSLFDGLDREKYELAIHPNFNPLLEGKASDGNMEKVVDNLLEIYPEAIGVRSHSMTQSSLILDLFERKGLQYDANHFLPYHNDLKPYKTWLNNFIKIPYNWEDDVHYLYGNSFHNSGLQKDNKGINVYDFHPIHVFLNTEKAQRYQLAKKNYHEPENLLSFRNTSDIPGSRNFLENLLGDANQQNLEIDNCKTLLSKYNPVG